MTDNLDREIKNSFEQWVNETYTRYDNKLGPDDIVRIVRIYILGSSRKLK